MQQRTKKYWASIVICTAILLGSVTGCSSDTTDNQSSSAPTPTTSNALSSDSTNSPEPTSEPTVSSKDITFGDMFEFDSLEITFGDSIEWVTLENQFSDKNGADVIRVPISVKNNKDETHGLNTFYCTLYGPDGIKLDGVSSYFDDDIDFAGNMRSGATQNKYMHILYNGDGDYYIEFDNWSTKIEVKLPIQK